MVFFRSFFLMFFYLWIFAACSRRSDSRPGCAADSVLSSIATGKAFEPDTLRLIFSGDYMQHIPQVKGARISEKEYDYLSTMTYMRPFFEKADYVIMNLETTLSLDNYTGFPLFRSPKACVEQLYEAGVNVLALANNHCCDNGKDGVDLTLQVVDSCGFLRTGMYRDSADYLKRNPLVLSKGDLKVALLNYTQHTNGLAVPQGAVVNKIVLNGKEDARGFG